jgi:hypothetical protein
LILKFKNKKNLHEFLHFIFFYKEIFIITNIYLHVCNVIIIFANMGVFLYVIQYTDWINISYCLSCSPFILRLILKIAFINLYEISTCLHVIQMGWLYKDDDVAENIIFGLTINFQKLYPNCNDSTQKCRFICPAYSQK